MKPALLLLCCLGLAAGELSGGRHVYLLPMSHSLDQFIANRLTREHVMQVVTDPARADTVLTDQVGEALEDRLKTLYPPPAPPPAEAKPRVKDTPDAAKAEDSKPKEEAAAPHSAPSILGDTVNKAEKAGSMGVGGRGRGTVFLVDVKSRQVLWSTFDKPKNSSPRELDHTAGRLVKRLKEDLAPKEK